MVVYLHARSTGIGSFEHTVCGDEVEVCLMRSRYVLLILFVATLKVASVFGQGIPVSFTLPEAGYLTLVIDGNDGARIRNLIQNTYFTAGEHTIYWDGYDEGAAGSWTGGSYEVKRNLVQPGTYRVRGLLHQGIDLIYEFSVQSPGDPAWHTLNGKGGWLADHSPAIDVLALPAGTYHKSTPVLQVVAPLAETGHGLIYLNEEGVKLQGVSHINNNNDFPTVSTRDLGPARGTDYLSWHAVHRGGSIKLVYAMSSNGKVSPNQFSTGIRTEAIHGIAAHNNQVAINYEGGIVFIDASRARDKTYQIIRTVDVPDVRGIATDGTYLYVIEGTSIRRYNVDYAEGKISNPVTVTTANLDDPQRIKLIDGELYVSDHGKSHQVKVFNLSGSLLRTIGLPGGPQVGLYDERRMSHPMGFDVDGQGKLWVAEYAYMPKRISRWDAKTGAFEKAWYGPPKYGGGLVLDPEDKTRAYYSGQAKGTIEFALNWSTGESKPKRILHNRELSRPSLPLTRKGTDSPIRVQVVNGRRYLFTPAWSQSHAAIYSELSIWVVRGDTAAWVAQVGDTGQWEKVFNDPQRYPDIYGYLQSYYPKSQPFFVWSDKNGDGDVSLDEVGFYNMPQFKDQKYYLDENLNIHLSGGSMLPLDRIDSRGVPIYDIQKFQEGAYVQSGTLGQIVYGAGTLITTHGPIEGYVNGKRQWLYHSQWPRRAKGAPLGRFEGDLIATTRLLGAPIQTTKGDAGAVWALNSEHGEIYLFTSDGLFISTLLEDVRRAPLWRFDTGTIKRGDPIQGVSPNNEHFWPFLNKGSDGEIYLTAGKEHSSILRLEGLQNVDRLDFGPLLVSEALLAGLDGTRDEQREVQQTKSLTAHIRSISPITDGKLLEWSNADWVVLDAKLGIEGAVAVDRDSLYLALRTGMPGLLNNVGDDFRYLFATGGGIDISIGKAGADPTRTKPVQGDRRIFITREGSNPVYGKLRAALYEQVNPSAPSGSSVQYTSPVNKVTLQYVAEISSSVSVSGTMGDFEVSIPLDVIGLVPQAGLSILGDVGVLTGDGVETQRRIYWNNKTNIITADVPSEAALTPEYWGVWTFTAGGDAMNIPPTGQFSAPTKGAAFAAGSNIYMDFSATDVDGQVTSVSFYANGQKLNEDNSPPFEYVWTNVPAGTYELVAYVRDDGRALVASEPVQVTVQAVLSESTRIHLQKGWNLIASPIDPGSAPLEAVFEEIKDDVVLVKDQTGSVYSPRFEINTIGSWDSHNAYSVYVEDDVDLDMSGTLIDPTNAVIHLRAGWNMVPYIRLSQLDAEAALACLKSLLILVKDGAGRVFYPEYGLNSIGTLVPGRGYKVYLKNDAVLIYPANDGQASQVTAVETSSSLPVPAASGR